MMTTGARLPGAAASVSALAVDAELCCEAATAESIVVGVLAISWFLVVEAIRQHTVIQRLQIRIKAHRQHAGAVAIFPGPAGSCFLDPVGGTEQRLNTGEIASD